MEDASPGHGTSLARWWGQPPQPSPSTDVMNQLCRVCGEPAAGFHFGAFTCEGCKSFFGRTYNNLGSITECKNNGECVINKKNRTACKACRLRKCLLVGMSKSGSRYGRRSNWFKIHCLLQEQQQVTGNAHLKDKAALALWGESYKSGLGIETDSKSSPTDEGITLNNNTSTKDRERSPQHPALPPTSYSTEAAAAIWAARSSFLPMQLPPNPMGMPFLPSPFASFPPAHHPQAQRGFLLPFMPNLQPPNAPLSSSPSRSSRASSCSQSPPPLQNHRSSPNPLERLQPEERRTTPVPPQKVSEEQSLAILRSLGPVQDQPMDLSLRIPENKCRRKNLVSRRIEDSESEGSVSCPESDSADQNDENFNKRKTPLDLTKVVRVTS